MLVTGLALALLTGGGFYFLYRKLPNRVRRFMQRHVLLTDTVAALCVYVLLGGTLTALFASAWLCLIVSLVLAITNNPTSNAILEKALARMDSVKTEVTTWLENVSGVEAQAKGEENTNL